MKNLKEKKNWTTKTKQYPKFCKTLCIVGQIDNNKGAISSRSAKWTNGIQRYWWIFRNSTLINVVDVNTSKNIWSAILNYLVKMTNKNHLKIIFVS